MEQKIDYIQKLKLFFTSIFVLADQVSDIFLFGYLIFKEKYGFAGKIAKHFFSIMKTGHSAYNLNLPNIPLNHVSV